MKLTIFHHLTKCAGRSFVECLRGQFGDRIASTGAYKPMAIDKKIEIECLHGEFSHPDMMQFQFKYGVVQRAYRFITILRDPVDQLLSYVYYFMETGRYPKDRDRIFDLSFLKEWEWDNTQCRQLSGMDHKTTTHKERYEMAKIKLAGYAAVGIVERFPETIQCMNWMFGWNLSYPKRIGANADRPSLSDEPKYVKEAVANCNEFDLRLYEFATVLFDEQQKG